MPDRYDGTTDFRQWLRHFDSCGHADNWEASERLRKLRRSCADVHRPIFYALSDEETSTYQHLKNNLQASLCPTAEREQHYRQFESRCFRPGEDPAVYRWELEAMLKMANASLTTDQRKALLTRQFMRGLPQHLQIRLLEHDPVPTLEKMVFFARNMSTIERNVGSDFTTAAVAAPADKLTELKQLVEKLATEQQHLRVQLKSTQEQQSKSGRSSTNCFSCGKRGHFARDCRNRKSRDPPSTIYCFNCGQPEHRARDCTSLNYQRATKPRLCAALP